MSEVTAHSLSTSKTAYEKCYYCDGHGHVVGDDGDLGICPECRGNTVIRKRNGKGRFCK
jgi:DnaJ-class molecular chaperone